MRAEVTKPLESALSVLAVSLPQLLLWSPHTPAPRIHQGKNIWQEQSASGKEFCVRLYQPCRAQGTQQGNTDVWGASPWAGLLSGVSMPMTTRPSRQARTHAGKIVGR